MGDVPSSFRFVVFDFAKKSVEVMMGDGLEIGNVLGN
jgi:hypothetical protein